VRPAADQTEFVHWRRKGVCGVVGILAHEVALGWDESLRYL
jgi:hypothetical protein